MNTIPELKINQVNLENNVSIKNIFFQKEYDQRTKFFWNQPGKIEIAGIDLFLSSNFSSFEEFQDLSEYYRKIIDSNQRINLLKNNALKFSNRDSSFLIKEKLKEMVLDVR